MMSESIEGSINLYPFTSSGYPTNMKGVLCGSNAFLFSEGIWAHDLDPKMKKCVTFGLSPVQASKGVLSSTNLQGSLFCM
jgi:hypothetical protein